MTTYAYWTLGIAAWIVIGLLMLRFVWGGIGGGIAMVAHNDQKLGWFMLVTTVIFWPFPIIPLAIFIWPMGWYDENKYAIRRFFKGDWKRREKKAKKEDPKRTNFDKVAQPTLTDDEVDALMVCIEMYVRWVAAQPTPSDLTPEKCAQRMQIAQRMASYLRNPSLAVREMVQMDFSQMPQNWHRK